MLSVFIDDESIYFCQGHKYDHRFLAYLRVFVGTHLPCKLSQ